MDLYLNKTETLRIHLAKLVILYYTLSLVGNILNYTTYYASRDVVVLLLQTGLNIMSVVFIKRHLKAKRELFFKKRINNMLPIDEKRIMLLSSQTVLVAVKTLL